MNSSQVVILARLQLSCICFPHVNWVNVLLVLPLLHAHNDVLSKRFLPAVNYYRRYDKRKLTNMTRHIFACNHFGPIYFRIISLSQFNKFVEIGRRMRKTILMK